MCALNRDRCGASRRKHAWATALVASATALSCATGMRPATPASSWQKVASGRPVPGNPDVCEDRWETSRPPGGAWDRIGLRRLAVCGRARVGQQRRIDVLYLPGTHMNASVVIFDDAHEFRLYLARRGVPVWSLDYRTHFVSPEIEDVDFMRRWTSKLFLDDVTAALAFTKEAGADTTVVAGFSRGASFAYALATRQQARGNLAGLAGLAGIVALDGIAPSSRSSGHERSGSQAAKVAIDIGSRRLPYVKRRALLAAVVADPSAPSTDPAFATVGERLAHILYTSRAFGGRGGLSDAQGGRSDIHVVARLLASYDRYWPAAVRPEVEASWEPASATKLPVFAAASTNMGESFTRAVAASARLVGGRAAS